MCLIGHLPFLFLLFQHFLYLDSTQLRQADFRPVFPSLPKGCNYCHTGVLDSLECVHDTTFIHMHMHLLIARSLPLTHVLLLPQVHYSSFSTPSFINKRSCCAAVTLEEIGYTEVVPSFSIIFHPLPKTTKPMNMGAPGPHGYCHRWC